MFPVLAHVAGFIQAPVISQKGVTAVGGIDPEGMVVYMHQRRPIGAEGFTAILGEVQRYAKHPDPFGVGWIHPHLPEIERPWAKGIDLAPGETPVA